MDYANLAKEMVWPTRIFGTLILISIAIAIYAFVRWVRLERKYKHMQSNRKNDLITSGIADYMHYQSSPEVHKEIIQEKNATIVKRLFVVFVVTGTIMALAKVDIRLLVGTPFLAVALIAIIEVTLNKLRK